MILNNTQELFKKYVSLNKELELKGGRKAVPFNSELEELYDSILNLEDKILSCYGLPKLFRFRELIFHLTTDKDFEDVIKQLKEAAEIYLSSSPESDTNLLQLAKQLDLRTYDVLPEIGIEDTLYSMFILEELFKKNKISAEELIEILKPIDEETSMELGHIYHYSVVEPDSHQAEVATEKLSSKRIKYLKEYLKFKPVYPY